MPVKAVAAYAEAFAGAHPGAAVESLLLEVGRASDGHAASESEESRKLGSGFLGPCIKR